MLQLKNIYKSYITGGSRQIALDGINLKFRESEFVTVLGPSGSGKTTFLNSLTKLYQPTAGEILLDGEPVDLKKHNIAYIFQEYSTMPWLTVEENVGFGLDIKGVEKEKAKALVNEYLDIVGLTKYRKYYPVCQHASARCNCKSFCNPAGFAANGRALWTAGYPAPLSSGR